MQELHTLWGKILKKVEYQVSSISYDLWVKTMEPLSFEQPNILVLACQNDIAKKQVERLHGDLLSTVVVDLFGEGASIKFLTPDEKRIYLEKNQGQSVAEERMNGNSKFNPKYTFDNFVVGKSNEYVYAAALAVSENPGKRFNPLFIYSGVGLGKTHLLNAIGNSIAQKQPKLKIVYATSEKFINDYVYALKHNSTKDNSVFEFRDKYRNIDVLMIDDIQLLSGKNGTQEEFFHTFNDLYESGKQIILSSDRPPKEIATLEERLRSRFARGLMQDMQLPDYETRVAILQKKADLEHYKIHQSVIELLAQKSQTNIREMEGLLEKVYFFSTLRSKSEATMEEALAALNEKEDRREGLTADKIIDTVCKYFGVEKQDLTGKKKSKDIVEPRMIAVYLIYDILGLPLVNIGMIMGGRDHTTIMHARDKISEQAKESSKIISFLSSIRSMLDELPEE